MIQPFLKQLQKWGQEIWCHWCSCTSEKPHIYIPGRSIGKEVEQLGYSKTRCQCLDELQNNLLTSKGCPVTEIMRFLHTSGPQQQFESGEQRGGNNGYHDLTYYLRSPHLSLADHIKIVRAGPAGEGKEIKESSPSKTWLWQSWELNV